MKTSNKIILSLVLFMIFGSVAAMVTIRKNLSIKKEVEYIGNGIIGKKILAESTISNSIEINGSHNVLKIDPNSTQVILEWEENFLDVMELVDEENFLKLRHKEHNNNMTYDASPILIVGIKGKDNLQIRAYSACEVKSLAPMKLSSLLINAQEHANLDIEVDASVITIYADDESKLKLTGKTEVVTIECGDEARVEMDALDINVLNVQLNDDANLSINKCDVATGFMRDHSRIVISGDMPEGIIDVKHDAQKIIKNPQ